MRTFRHERHETSFATPKRAFREVPEYSLKQLAVVKLSHLEIAERLCGYAHSMMQQHLHLARVISVSAPYCGAPPVKYGVDMVKGKASEST